MSVTRSASALRRPVFRSARLAPFVVLAVLLALLGGLRVPTAQASSSPTTPIHASGSTFWFGNRDFELGGTRSFTEGTRRWESIESLSWPRRHANRNGLTSRAV